MAKSKTMTVTIEFELGQRQNRWRRIDAAYQAAVKAAVGAAKAELLDGSVSTVRSRLTHGYRVAGLFTQYPDVDAEAAPEPPVE
ncbi:hypothetical protein [Streptomyces olivaceiscleroticus]|uniref:Uncharacterized protein n=1 Tax=Streptomyces olivaceiscleroticus TaxID=68245 RepID=A0ABP3K7P5_9ACTN